MNDAKKKMAAVKRIVVHGGAVHEDELIAISLALNYTGLIPIYRIDPSKEDLIDDQTLVLDVGMQYDPKLLNFDHHGDQFKGKRECAYTLLAKFLDIERMLKREPWYWTFASLDNLGPTRTAKELSMPKGALIQLQSPLTSTLKYLIQKKTTDILCSIVEPYDELLQDFGENIITKAQRLEQRLKQLRDGKTKRVSVNDIVGYRVFTNREDEPTFGLNEFIRELDDKKKVAFTITEDDRGAGWTLFRIDDNPKLDFSILKNDKDIIFAHRGGFVAKTKDVSFSKALQLVGKATKKS